MILEKIKSPSLTTITLFSLILTVVLLPVTLDQQAEASHPKKVKNLTGTEGDESVSLEWDRPTGGTTPQDYIISYKLTTATSWSKLSDGVNTRTTFEVTDLVNNISYDFKVAGKKLSNSNLRYSDPITLVPYSTNATVNPETDRCNQPGADGSANRCYAIHVFNIHSSYHDNVEKFKGKINVDDVNVPDGFVGAAYWLEFTPYTDEDDDRNDRVPILEFGIIDQSGSISHPKFYCAEDGDIQSRTWSASANRDYNFEIVKKSTSANGDRWGLTVNGNNCSDITVPAGVLPDKIFRGTETSRDSSPSFEHEFKWMQLKLDNFSRYYVLQPYFLKYQTYDDYLFGVTDGYFMDRCGSGTELYYHIETGKGVRSNC